MLALRAALGGLLLTAPLAAGTGTCQPAIAASGVRHNGYQQHATINYNQGYNQNYNQGYNQNYQQHVVANDPYYVTNSALVFKVSDPEKDALARNNEKLTDALIDELKARRTEAAGAGAAGDPTDAAAGDGPPQPLRGTKAPSPELILKTRCATCHGGDKATGGFALTKDAAANYAYRTLVNEVINGKEANMPPKEKPQLTEAEKKIIASWATRTRTDLKKEAGMTVPPPAEPANK